MAKLSNLADAIRAGFEAAKASLDHNKATADHTVEVMAAAVIRIKQSSDADNPAIQALIDEVEAGVAAMEDEADANTAELDQGTQALSDALGSA